MSEDTSSFFDDIYCYDESIQPLSKREKNREDAKYLPPKPKSRRFFPKALKTYPAQYQVVWLYFRDYPASSGSGALLKKERGGAAWTYTRIISTLVDNGLLYKWDFPADYQTIYRGPKVAAYRICIESEEVNAKPYSKPGRKSSAALPQAEANSTT